tara:strand:+ start:748 stop:1104 length:357 start_codon:yes stop_codon:yes gene_type:complete
MHTVGSAISAQNAKARAASIGPLSSDLYGCWVTVSEAVSEYMEYHLDCESDEWHDLDADFTKLDEWIEKTKTTYQLPHGFEVRPSNDSHTLTCNGYFVFNGSLNECFIAFGGHLDGLR